MAIEGDTMLKSFALTFAMFTVASSALADCVPTSPTVKIYLATLPGWHIVTETDLRTDDQALWRQHHSGACPGLAKADLKGDGGASYGLVLRSGERIRKVILVSDNRVLREHLVIKHRTGAIPVVHVAEPGPAYEFETRKRHDIAHQSLVFETMEASATQYYWHDGKLKDVLITD
jgi:hypothetical protein